MVCLVHGTGSTRRISSIRGMQGKIDAVDCTYAVDVARKPPDEMRSDIL